MNYEAPITLPSPLAPDRVLPEWIDYNGHMNVAYYVLAFDLALDSFSEIIGLGPAYKDQTNCSTFVLQINVNYVQEVLEGDPLRFTFQLLDHDAKRFHYIMSMYHATEGYLSATSEQITMHMDLTARRGAEMPDDVQEKITAIAAAHGAMEQPAQVGQVIGIRRKTQAAE